MIVSGIPNLLSYCVIFILYTQFTYIAAGCIIQPGRPHRPVDWRPMLYPMAHRPKLVLRTLWAKSFKLSFLLAVLCVPYHIRLIKLPSNVFPPMFLHVLLPQFHSAFLASSWALHMTMKNKHLYQSNIHFQHEI
jgi:hypothetical protein